MSGFFFWCARCYSNNFTCNVLHTLVCRSLNLLVRRKCSNGFVGGGERKATKSHIRHCQKITGYAWNKHEIYFSTIFFSNNNNNTHIENAIFLPMPKLLLLPLSTSPPMPVVLGLHFLFYFFI